MGRNFHLDETIYNSLLQKVASLSLLFNDGPQAHIDYRFVEKLFVLATTGRNISRSDKVFDAIVGNPQNIGVGVKTFIKNPSAKHKIEKVQELTRYSGSGALNDLALDEVVHKVSTFRNNSILADASEYGINIEKSIYHCLVRTGEFAMVHEEPYPLIDVSRIVPTDTSGRIVRQYSNIGNNIKFFDGINYYTYSKSKSVLMKKFDLTLYENYKNIPIEIDYDIWSKLSPSYFEREISSKVVTAPNIGKQHNNLAGKDYVVLPLYSTRSKEPKVEAASGINQWNAGGRIRKYGEAYIPIPRKLHDLAPNFFPAREITFKLKLPNSDSFVDAKVCQDNGKALMSNPNDQLCKWLYKVIDPKFSDYDFNRPPNRTPFTYKDLVEVGRDSVVVSKRKENNDVFYEISFAELGSYEDFLNEFES